MGERIKVLWLIKGLGAGGAERLLVSAARVADHRTFRYEVAYVVHRKNTLVPDLGRHGIISHCLSGSGSRALWPLALRRLLVAGQYDVVHLHSPLVAGVARLTVRTIARARRPQLVSTEHNMWGSYAVPTRLLNASLHRADRRRWAVSGAVRSSMWRPFRRGVEVLVHGIVMADAVVSFDRDVERRALGLCATDVVAVTVANFRPEKAYPDLLAALDLASRSAPQLRLLVVGQGPLETEIRRLHGQLGLHERCLILGYREDVSRILALSDFFVLASRFEGLPIALMEAMASGLPVVATRAGGIPEAVTHGREGLLTSPGQPAALAEAIAEVANDPAARERMSEHARRRGRAFDVRTAVHAYEDAYRDLTSPR